MLRDDRVTTVDNIVVPPTTCSRSTTTWPVAGASCDLDSYKPDYLPILSRDVLLRIASGDACMAGDGAAGGG